VEAITDLIVQVHQRVPGSKLHLLSVGSPTVRNTKDAGMKRLVLCSRNKKKLREMTELLGGLGFDLTDLSPYPNAPEVAETAGSFIGNATLKAATLAPILGEWTIGEDSGLVVPILGGAPGVDSALYAGKHGDDAANNAKLLAELKHYSGADRAAYYISTVVLANPTGQVIAAAE